MKKDDGKQIANRLPARPMLVFMDGQFVPGAEAVVSVFDRCFLYGDGLFETIRLYEGKPFRWVQHYERLHAGARALDIPIPLAPEALLAAIHELWRRNDAISEAIVRLTLSRGVGPRGYSPSGARSPRIVMALHPMPRPEARTSFKVITSSIIVPANDPLSRYKTCNKLHQIVARSEADSVGAQEALMINSKGCVAEASSSNLFWLSNQVICTPPLRAGALAGITRGVVFEIASNLGIPVAELEITSAGLLDAAGIFLSMSTQELVAVTELDGHPIPRAPMLPKLQDAYRILVRKELATKP